MLLAQDVSGTGPYIIAYLTRTNKFHLALNFAWILDSKLHWIHIKNKLLYKFVAKKISCTKVKQNLNVYIRLYFVSVVFSYFSQHWDGQKLPLSHSF